MAVVYITYDLMLFAEVGACRGSLDEVAVTDSLLRELVLHKALIDELVQPHNYLVYLRDTLAKRVRDDIRPKYVGHSIGLWPIATHELRRRCT